MNKFLPYEQALALKELGFDEPCFGTYLSSLQSDWKVYELILEMGMNEKFEDNRNVYLSEGACSAPTFSQAFDFFREKYGLEGVTQRAEDFIWYKWIIHRYNENAKKYVADWYEYKTYEEAELECIKILIEITENK